MWQNQSTKLAFKIHKQRPGMSRTKSAAEICDAPLIFVHEGNDATSLVRLRHAQHACAVETYLATMDRNMKCWNTSAHSFRWRHRWLLSC